MKSRTAHSPRALKKAQVPASNALLLTNFAREQGHDPSLLLSSLGITETQLADDAQWLSVSQCAGLMALVRAQTGVEALGYEMGSRMPGTAHGLFGLGILSSATPQQALELAAQFFQVRNPTFDLHWSVSPPWVEIHLTDLMPLAPLRQTSIEWVLLSMLKMGEMLMGTQEAVRAACEMRFPWPEPDYHARYAHLLPRCHFNAKDAVVCIPSSWLLQRLNGAAPATVQLARQACERDLALSGKKTSTTKKVRALMEKALERCHRPSRSAIADKLHISTSTLRRLLAAENTSYIALLDDTRLQHACKLLTRQDLTVESIAAQLGYDNTANFTRGFKRWCGKTPSDWRKTARGA